MFQQNKIVKVALSIPINKYHEKKWFKELAYNIMVNASNKGICVEFWRKNNTTLVYLLSNCWQVLKIFYVLNLLNIIFDDFSIWLLGYRTKFSCLYFPQGQHFISTVWLIMKHRWISKFLILSSSLKKLSINACTPWMSPFHNCTGKVYKITK